MCTISLKKQYVDHPLWMWLLDILVITILTLFFSWLIINEKFTGEFFKSVTDIETPELIDLYTLSANRSGCKNRSDIVLVPTDGCARQDIIKVLKTLRTMDVAGIGIDITFPYPEDEDEMLIEAVLSDKRIVMASRKDGSYFEDILKEYGVDFGSIQLDINTRYDIVRTFKPIIIDGDTVCSFEMLLAQRLQPNDNLPFPKEESSYIAYAQVVFDTIPAIDFIKDPSELDNLAYRLVNKIIILGDLNEVSDTYRTPLQPDMPGSVIHAYITNTILKNRYITCSPELFSWIAAIILSVLFSWLMLWLKWAVGDAEGLALRCLQFLLMGIVVVVGVMFFYHHDYYINMEPIFFALAIQAVALDIWVGLMGLIYKNK